MHRILPPAGPWTALALAAAATPLAAQTPIDPFSKGPRWEHAADAAAPAIARDVTLLGDGGLGAAGLAHGQPRMSLLGCQHEPGGPLLAEDGSTWAGAEGVIAVEGLQGWCFGAAALTESAGSRIRVARYSPAAQPAWIADWVVDLASLGTSGMLMESEADLVLLAQSIASPPAVRLTALEAATGALRFELELAGGTLRALDLDQVGGRAAVLAGSETWVVDTLTGQALFHRHDQDPARSVALSGDGETLVVGTAALLEVLDDQLGDGVFQPQATLAGGANDYPVAVDLSLDGSFLALGWWDGLSGRTVRLETWDLVGVPVRLNHLAQVGPPFGPQNYVSQARVTPDGQRAAFGLWGLGWAEPEVVLFDRGQVEPLVAQDLAGSVYSIDLSADGTRLLVGRKQGHANTLGSHGAVELIDTGERQVELSSSAVGTGTTDVWLSAPGAQSAALLMGTPAARPLTLGGLTGSLWLDPSQPWALVPAQPAGVDRFVVPLSIPASAVGLDLVLQGLSLVPGPLWPTAQLLDDVVRPTIL